MYFATVSNVRKEELRGLLRTLLLAGIGTALYAFPEHFGLSPSCVIITGTWGVSCWVQDVQTRVFGTFGQPNWLAAYLITVIPLALWWIADGVRRYGLRGKTDGARWWPVIWPSLAAVLMLLVVVYTGSRSGFAGLVLGLGMLFVVSIWHWIRSHGLPGLLDLPGGMFAKTQSPQKLHKNTWVLVPAVLIVISGFLFLLQGTPFTPGVRALFENNTASSSSTVSSPVEPTSSPIPTVEDSVPDAPAGGTVLESGGTDSGVIRRIVWEGALRVWRRYPLFGSGVETFAYSYYRDRPIEHNYVSEWDFLYNKAHNEYLNFLATTGVFGLGSVLLLMGAFAFFSIRAILSRKNLEHSLFAAALLAGYAALAVSNLLGFSTVAVATLFFLWPAFLEILQRDPASAVDSAGEKTGRSASKSAQEELEITLDLNTLLTGGVFLLGAILLLWVYGMWSNDRQLAMSKRLLNSGQAVAAYQTLDMLTKRAPGQAEYWEQKGIVVAQLAVTAAQTEVENNVDPTSDTDANTSGTSTASANTLAALTDNLIQEAVATLNAATEVNPVHLNIWKSRARGYIWLGTIDQKYLWEAIDSLLEAQKLAPTDPKVTYNLALLYDSVKEDDKAEEYYQQSLALRSVYEQARKSYAEFLTRTGRYAEALEQYRYIDEVLKPDEPLFTEEIAALEASVSAERSEGEGR